MEVPNDKEKPDNDSATADSAKKPSNCSTMVIFAVDVSGSMCTTTEVPALQAEWTSVTGRGGGGGTRHISRLEAIKEAVSRHLSTAITLVLMIQFQKFYDFLKA